MKARIVTRIPGDPRLGRHVEHDPRSWRYRKVFPRKAIQSVKHQRFVPVFDQGYLGACTAYAAIGCLGTGLFYETVGEQSIFSQTYMTNVYHLATQLDEIPGEYPPDDTGSTGLGVAKAVQSLELISGYQHTFSFDDAMAALSLGPVITGVNWYNGFFYPDSSGIIRISRNDYVAGGHEFVLDEIDIERELIGATNSWGPEWGLGGRFYIPFEVFARLLDEQGDVTLFVPVTEPAPEPIDPEPVPEPVEPEPQPEPQPTPEPVSPDNDESLLVKLFRAVWKILTWWL